ncbi:MAG TPA: hypothetical protein QGF58_25860 [Myxococcota bacterium]|nr:hypothetical protein [Myxococcota bacterium]
MDERDEPARPVDMIADELRLQAWLAKAEVENPSVRKPENFERLSLLALTRDELRLQMHLGKLELRDGWEEHEERWRHLMKWAGDTREDVEDKVEETLEALERGYRLIRHGG